MTGKRLLMASTRGREGAIQQCEGAGRRGGQAMLRMKLKKEGGHQGGRPSCWIKRTSRRCLDDSSHYGGSVGGTLLSAATVLGQQVDD